MAISANPKTGNGSSKTTRKASTRAAPKSAAPRRRASSARRRISEVPSWAATIASVVGVGVAVGVGLFATRHQWLPKAEQWGDQLASRFLHEDDELFEDEIDAMADDDDEWDGKVSHAAYPERDLYPSAQAVS